MAAQRGCGGHLATLLLRGAAGCPQQAPSAAADLAVERHRGRKFRPLRLSTAGSDPGLTAPLYFFLGNLAFLDASYSFIVAPRMLVDFLSEKKVIKLACTDTFVVELLMVSNSGLLTLLASWGFWPPMQSSCAVAHTVQNHRKAGRVENLQLENKREGDAEPQELLRCGDP
ncbi:hypothetical protein QTO34_019545 [Cnephaeus nilssonii]|uniref:Uncharacterized protein n=1 Tax=Cnephaeus nilssonii TaxID=3371016 RepID=A0AA40LP55_CNENI|nr:hypothetical protein QTO34_019545 [Eptesicus nilssonii]